MRELMVRWLLVLCLAGANGLLGQPFFFRKDIPVGEGPMAVVAGDFNGDRRPDLAVGTQDGLYVVLNLGGGKFGTPIRTEAAPAFWLSTAADFNNDGKDDLVGSGFLYPSRGDGTFLPPRRIGAQEAVAAADFNRDGKMDLLIANYGVRVLLGNGDGTFSPGAVVTSTPMSQVRVADFNRDGRIDVATILPSQTATAAKNFLVVFLGRGDGTFGPEIRTPVTGGALVADFNGDGLPDVFTENYSTGFSVLLGNGDGSFRSPIPYTRELRTPYGVPVAAGDFTGDGRVDLVMWTVAWFYICPGKGDGTFSPLVEMLPTLPMLEWGRFEQNPYAVSAVDLDGDGRLDLVAANGDNAVSVMLAKAEWSPALRRALSAVNYTAAVSPGSLATLFAPTPATASESASPPWPTRLGGISLEVRDSAGATQMAPLLFVSPTQINFRVPAAAAPGEATLTLIGGSGATLAGSMEVDPAAPALFTTQPPGWPVLTAVMVEPDGTQVPATELDCDPDYGCPPSPGILLSTAGDRPVYLSFYGTGFRSATADNVTCYLRNADGANEVQAPVVYAGPQATPGVDQINVRLLPEVLGFSHGGEWRAYVTIRINGVPANRVYIYGR